MGRILGSGAWMALLLAATVANAGTPASHRTARHHEQRIAITVTSKGFEPSTVHAKAGEPILLVVTRKTEQTCAKEIVIARAKIHRPLPLNQPVFIRVAPQRVGTLRYACGMDMVAGQLVID